MEQFPDKIYGVCPIGHNPKPSGATGDNLSTTQIPEGEGRRLFWSHYFQKYVCSACLRITKADRIADGKFHDEQVRVEKKMSGMGIEKQ